MTKIQNHQIWTESEPGFMIKIVGAPETAEDLLVLNKILTEQILWIGSVDSDQFGVSAVREQYWELPYEQGPGWVLVEKLTEAQAIERDLESWGEPRPFTPGWNYPEDYPPARYSGWWVTFGYTDSMTNIFDSPVWINTDEPTEIFVNEM